VEIIIQFVFWKVVRFIVGVAHYMVNLEENKKCQRKLAHCRVLKLSRLVVVNAILLLYLIRERSILGVVVEFTKILDNLDMGILMIYFAHRK
jgi:hypothetical protein